jgi:hypothetical protein
MISLPLLYAVYGEQYFVSEKLSQGFFDILTPGSHLWLRYFGSGLRSRLRLEKWH